MICDMHMHSTMSDGTLSVEALVAEVKRAGVHAFSITDHDTVAGWEQTRQLAREHGLETVIGTEISTRIESHELHILGYGFDPDDAALAELFGSQKAARHRRIPLIVQRLNELDVPLTVEQVMDVAKDSNPGRPHVAQALLNGGHVASIEEAFTRYLGDGAPAHIRKEVPTPQRAVRAIAQAGGRAVWAHPLARPLQRTGGVEHMAGELARAGLFGLEVTHPSQTPYQRKRLRKIARRFNLFETGGSDFHGAVTPHLTLGRGRGGDQVPVDVFERLAG